MLRHAMRYDPKLHHRRSIRLAGFDYSTSGAYFVTICTQHGACLLGHVRNGEMFANDAGRMVSRWWNELAKKYPRVVPDQHIVMPNHFHGVVIIQGDPIPHGPVPVGAALRGHPETLEPVTMHATTTDSSQAGAPLHPRSETVWLGTL
jgi:hypothetical protein